MDWIVLYIPVFFIFFDWKAEIFSEDLPLGKLFRIMLSKGKFFPQVI